MLYTKKKPPDWLKNLPKGAIGIGVEVFNNVFGDTKDEDRARRAAWAAIEAKYKKGEDGEWRAKEAMTGAERSHPIRFRAARQVDEQGLVWEAILIAPGLSSGYPRFYWTDEVLSAAAGVFQGVDINAYELTADFFTHLPIPNLEILDDVKRYLVAKKVGWVEKTWWAESEGIKATIRFFKEAAWLPKMIQQGMNQGNSEVLGLSIDARIQGMEVVVDDFSVVWVTKIVSASSVDVVTYPAAGGKFIRAVAGLGKNHKGKETIMDREELLKLIEESRPELLEGKDRAALSDDEIKSLARMAMEKPKTDDGGDKKGPVKDPADGGDNGDGTKDQRAAQAAQPKPVTQEDINKAIKDATGAQEKRAACGRMLDEALSADDKLPPNMAKRIRKQFEGKVFTREELDAGIKNEKEYLAAMSGPSLDLGDQTRINVGYRSLDKAQMAVDRMFGLSRDDMVMCARLDRLDHKPFFEDMRAAQDYD